MSLPYDMEAFAPRRLSCGILVLNGQRELLLCHVTGQDHWDLPKGGAHADESPLQAALREDGLFQRWRATQEDPDAVDPALGATDPAATVHGEQHDLKIDLVATTSIPGTILKHRLRLLAGQGWQLRDVTSA